MSHNYLICGWCFWWLWRTFVAQLVPVWLWDLEIMFSKADHFAECYKESLGLTEGKCS